jgi:hypothetical protein
MNNKVKVNTGDFRFFDKDTQDNILNAFISYKDYDFEQFMEGFVGEVNGDSFDPQKEELEGNRDFAEGYTCAKEQSEIFLVDVQVK